MLDYIEFFAGIGSQKKALDRQNIQSRVVGISEWDVNAIIAYDAIHTNDGIDYTIGMTKLQIYDELKDYTFSTDGKEPCDLKRVKEKTLRQLYNANKRTKNLGDITKINTLPQANLWTYSFPCQDISVAGKQAGIKKGTRSGLLYEIERLLEICKSNNELPEYLLLENVKNLVGKEFKLQFEEWLSRLEELGYNSYWKVLNAKHYGVAQNRERVFAVSIRKDIDGGAFTFPEGFDNGLRLKDFLESEVDEKYYISGEKVKKLLEQLDYENKDKVCCDMTINTPKFKDIGNCIMARYDCRVSNQKSEGIAVVELIENTNTPIQAGILEGDKWDKMHDISRRYYNPEGIAPTIHTCQGGNTEPKIIEDTNEIIKVGTIDGKNFNENKVVYDTLGVAPTIQGQGHCGNEPKIVQAVGDRGNHTYSVKDHAFTIPANPMSDRGQMVIENIDGRTLIDVTKLVVGLIDDQGRTTKELGLKDCCPTLRAQSHGNEPKILEDFYASREVREYVDCPTIRADRQGLKVVTHSPYVDKKYQEFIDENGYIPEFFNPYNKSEITDIAPTLTAQGDSVTKSGTVLKCEFENELKFVGGIQTGDMWIDDGKKLSRNYRSGNRVYDVDGIAVAQTAEGGGLAGCTGLYKVEEIPSPELVGGIGEKNFGQQYRQGNRIYDVDKTAMCLLSQPVGNTGGNSYLYAVKEPQYRIRKLTEVECYKLMGFDKEDALKVKAVGISNSQMHKQAGNSIVVNVLECVFNALFNK